MGWDGVKTPIRYTQTIENKEKKISILANITSIWNSWTNVSFTFPFIHSFISWIQYIHFCFLLINFVLKLSKKTIECIWYERKELIKQIEYYTNHEIGFKSVFENPFNYSYYIYYSNGFRWSDLWWDVILFHKGKTWPSETNHLPMVGHSIRKTDGICLIFG